jgi:hypothetical protein
MIVWLIKSGVGVRIAAIKKLPAKIYLNFCRSSFGVMGINS